VDAVTSNRRFGGTWPDPGSNPGRRGGKPTTNRLGYGAASTASYRGSFALLTLRGICQFVRHDFGSTEAMTRNNIPKKYHHISLSWYMDMKLTYEADVLPPPNFKFGFAVCCVFITLSPLSSMEQQELVPVAGARWCYAHMSVGACKCSSDLGSYRFKKEVSHTHIELIKVPEIMSFPFKVKMYTYQHTLQ
jgi:hypothetical protein